MRIFISIFLFSFCLPVWGASVDRPIEVNDKAPIFSLKELMGDKQINLADYRGKVVYLDFWASWCVPCLRSFPALADLHKRYAAQGFEVIAVNLDEESDAAVEFVKQFPQTYPLVAGFNTEVPDQYQIEVMPTAYFIDGAGIVRLVHHGFKDEHIDFLEAILQKLLAEL